MRFHKKSGIPVRLEPLVLTAALLLAGGCNYGLRGGGGFPSHIETIYIAPFKNETTQFQLPNRLFQALQSELPATLGVQSAGKRAADAVLRGTIIAYDNVVQNTRRRSGRQLPDVLTHRVEIVISAQLIDKKRNVILWETQSLRGEGDYRPSRSEEIGRAEAIDALVQQIIEGARSQW